MRLWYPLISFAATGPSCSCLLLGLLLSLYSLLLPRTPFLALLLNGGICHRVPLRRVSRRRLLLLLLLHRRRQLDAVDPLHVRLEALSDVEGGVTMVALEVTDALKYIK